MSAPVTTSSTFLLSSVARDSTLSRSGHSYTHTLSIAMMVWPAGSPRLGGRSAALSDSTDSREHQDTASPPVGGVSKKARHSVPNIPTIVLSPPVEGQPGVPKFLSQKRGSLPNGKYSSHQVGNK